MDKKPFSYASRYKIPKSKSVIPQKKESDKDKTVSNKTKNENKNHNTKNNINVNIGLNKPKTGVKKNQPEKIFYFEDNAYYNLVKKERDKLAEYINNNENADIRLIGNERYTQIPISKFINDDKKNLSDDKMGLIPLPLRNMKRQSKAQELYKIQRSLVRMRRLQYDKMRRKKDYDNEFIERIIYIQRWWKKIILTNKTKKIQINYKLYKIRKKIKRNKKLIQILYNLIYFKIFSDIRKIKYIKRPIINNCSYISKSFSNLSIKAENKLKKLQKNIIIFLKSKNLRKIQKIKKDKIGYYADKIILPSIALKFFDFIARLRSIIKLMAFRKISKFRKKDYNTNYINDVVKIQKTYKLHYNKSLFDSRNLIRVNSSKNISISYISIKRMKKNYRDILLIQKNIKLFLQKVKSQNNIIKNKPKSYDYNRIKNQQFYLNKNCKYSIDNRIKDRNILNNKNNLKRKDFKSKIFESSFNRNNKLNNKKNYIYSINNNNLNPNNDIINYIYGSYISKYYIVNVTKKIIQIQTNFRKYIYQKKIKEEKYNIKNIPYIRKNNINKYFLISKVNINRQENLEKIIKIENEYKKRFKYFKNNILTLPYSKNCKNAQNKNKENANKSISVLSTNNFKSINKKNDLQNKNNNKLEYYYKGKNEKEILMSSLINKNKKPIIIEGFFYSKIRINLSNRKLKTNYTMITKSVSGIYISKTRIMNNIKKIEFLQKEIKKRIIFKIKEEENMQVIKKPEIKRYKIKNDKDNKEIAYKNKKAKLKIKKNKMTDIIAEKIYVLYNKDNLYNFPHLNMNNYYYISKTIKLTDKSELSSEKEYESIKNELIRRKNVNLETSNDLFISKIKSEISPKEQKNKKLSLIPLNLIKQTENKEDGKDINLNFEKEFLTFRELNLKEDKPLLKLNNNICYIEKVIFFNIKQVKNIKENNDEIINKKQMNFHDYLNDDKIVKNKIKEKDKNEFNDSINNKFSFDKNNYFNDNNIININNKNDSFIKKGKEKNNHQIISENNIMNEIRSTKKEIVSEIISNGDTTDYLQKRDSFDKTRKIRNNIILYNKISYFQNKKYYLYFFQLLIIFIVKNIQEYIFYKIILKLNKKSKCPLGENNENCKEKINFDFPFYIKTLYRLFVFFKKNDIKTNTIIKKFFIQNFPFYERHESFFYNVTCLSAQNKKKLINKNIFDLVNNKKELIEFFDNFINYDINISNKNIIINIINEYSFENKNIFQLIKIIDKEIQNQKKNNFLDKK